MEIFFAGVDLGTSGIKAGIIDERGRIIAEVYRDTELVSEAPGRMKQDPDSFCSTALKTIREVVEKSKIEPSRIIGLALDGQMGGIIGIDRNFDSVTGLDMGLDIRSEKYNALMQREYGQKLAELTCGSPRNTPKMMMWAREFPEIYGRVHKFVTLSGYVTGIITGISGDDACIDYTLLSFFGNEDARNLSWSDELTRMTGLDAAKLPKVVEPWHVVGGLTSQAASESGLPAGLPVAAGAGDQPAGFLGAGFLKQGELLDVSGSTTLLCAAVDRFVPDTERASVMFMPSVIAGKYTAFTYINGGGISLKWFRDEFGGGLTWDELTAAAAGVPPGACGLQFLPYFGGRQCPYDSETRGAWIGLNWGHKKEHLFRAILEGLAFDHALGLEHISRLFPHIRSEGIDGSGGGAQNPLWNRIKADILNLPYRRLGEYQFALRGCALIAGFSQGIFDNLEEAAVRMNAENESELIVPDSRNAEEYRKHLEIFKESLLSPLESTMGKLSSP
ncbi:MAG: xylulokinase [Spirochaetota bacterium]